jgi:Na+-driven multidrug efflux pump
LVRNLISDNLGYWAIGLPTTVLLIAYANGGILSLWLGPLAALIVNSSLYYLFISRMDWDIAVKESEERMNKGKKQ